MDRTNSFGYWLRRRRKALDLTQVELAQRVNCSPDTIKKIEADARRPSRQLAKLLADQLLISLEERDGFLAAARAERSIERLALTEQPVIDGPVMVDLPAFMDPANAALTEARPLFVGRESELASLHAYLTAALNAHGRVVFITGEAGQGKSALMSEFARRAQETHSTLIVAGGNCNAIAGAGDPYLPFRDVMGMLSGDVETRWARGLISQEQARRLWEALPETARALVEEGPDLIGMFATRSSLMKWAAMSAPGADWIKRLRALLERDSQQHSELQQVSLFEQYTRVLRRLSAGQPLLILLDDLQWADNASLNLLFHLGRRLSGSRILVIGAYRPSDVELGRVATGSSKDSTHPLKPVISELKLHFGEIQVDTGWETPAKGRTFVGAVLDSEPNLLPDSFREAFFQRTRGHPLFTVELFHDLQARSYLLLDEQGRWVQGPDLNWNSLPARVEAVIEQRIDRLDAKMGELLGVASVEGEVFNAQVLARVQGWNDWQVLGQLAHEAEQRHRLVAEQGEWIIGQSQLSRYRFTHILFQQYLYKRLSFGERRRLHAEVGRAIESLCKEDLEAVTILLAHHFAEAGNKEKAVKYLLMAGDRARTLYAHEEAIQYYRRALSFLKEMHALEQTAQTLMKLGQSYHNAFDYESARQAYEEGFVLWQRVEAARPVASWPPAPHPLRMIWQEPYSLDPTMGGWNLTAPITLQLFSGLVAHSPEMEVVPDVAYRWEILDGGRQYVFHLRGDVTWSDGQPVTAHDFEFTFKRALDPATHAPVAGLLLYGIRGAREFHQGKLTNPDQVGVSAVDERTLVIELEEPSSYFIQDLSYYVLLPVPRHDVEKHRASWAEPQNLVTNGPFRLREWQRGKVIILERNRRYHGRYDGNLEQVWLTLDAGIEEHFDLYESDQLDVVYNWFFLGGDMDPLRWRHSGEYLYRPRFCPVYLIFNLKQPPFDDARVRRAFAMTIDKTRMMETVEKGYHHPATGGFIPPGMPGHTPGIGLPFDPERARQSLAEAGYPEGVGFPTVTLRARRQSIIDFLISAWRQYLGVNIDVQIIPPSGILTDNVYGPLIIMGGWWADYADPDNFLRVDVKLDAPEWRNEEYERLLERARQITDQAQRMELYQQADHILMEEAIVAPLFYVQSHLLLKPWVKRFPTAAIKSPGFWKDVVITPHE
jgi:ABC-type oligopeptide transport system substrate-binding subunit/transcriptional regulator with XRE-family HTH domain